MNKLEVIDAKIEFCRYILEYRKCFEANYDLVNKLNDTFLEYKKLGVLKGVSFNRSDAIMHNKLALTLKEFKKRDIDPVFFYDKAANDYYVGNFYIRYIITYLNNIVIEMYKHFHKTIDELDCFTKDTKKLANHFIKIAITAIKGGNLILEDEKCREDIERILYEAKMYQEKLDELYAFDIREDYFKIVQMILDTIFKNNNRDTFVEAIIVQYNVDVDYLTKMGLENKLSGLKEIYLEYLNAFHIDASILDFELEPYFTSTLPETNEIMELVKLQTPDLTNLLNELKYQKLTLLASGDASMNAPKDIADVLALTNGISKLKK